MTKYTHTMITYPRGCRLTSGVGNRKNKQKEKKRKERKKSRPQKGPQNKFIVIDQLDAIRHETLGTNPEGTVHSLENKI